MSPAARAALTQVEGLPLQERGVAAEEQRNEIFGRSARNEARNRETVAQTGQAGVLAELMMQLGVPSKNAGGIFKRMKGAIPEAFSGYFGDLATQQEKERKALADDEAKKKGTAGAGGGFRSWFSKERELKPGQEKLPDGTVVDSYLSQSGVSYKPTARPKSVGEGSVASQPLPKRTPFQRPMSTEPELRKRLQEVETKIALMSIGPGQSPASQDTLDQLVKQRDQILTFLHTLGVK
jgi:hypothetical protein